MKPNCNAPDCTSENFVKAHIIPQGFARTLHQLGGHNIEVSPTVVRRAKRQMGEFDSSILCKDCDARIGRLDEYGLSVAERFPKGPYHLDTIVRLPEVDGGRFALFVLSVVWRASLSTRPSCTDVQLGPYEARAGDVIFGRKTLADIPEYELIAHRYSSPYVDTRQFYTMPFKSRYLGVNAFLVGLGGFQLIAKFDKRPFPDVVHDLIVNGAGHLNCFVISLEDTVEIHRMVQVKRAARKSFR
jgi:hypothetical protein